MNFQEYYKLLKKLREGKNITSGEYASFMEYSANIDESRVKELDVLIQKDIKDGKLTPDPANTAERWLLGAQRTLSSPEYKEMAIEMAEKAAAGKISDKISQGINLVLAGTDIANSIAQIGASNKALRQSKRPSRPAVPQRDIYLQQALRDAQEGGFDAARATAPVQAEIQDQYLNDLQNAKTASTGQAGAYGAYGQLAANRRNRASLNLAPIQDEIRRGQQGRYDQLLGQRLQETQNMFQNQASLYPYDLNQYQQEQQAAANLGSVGRENLRGSLYNFGNQIPQAVGESAAQRKYRRLKEQIALLGGDKVGDMVVQGNKYLDNAYDGRRYPTDITGMVDYYNQAHTA